MAKSTTKYSNNPDFGSPVRAKTFKYIVVAIAAIFIVRLGYLQIIKGAIYKASSQTQAIKQDVVEPFRGNLYDRNGLLLVHNEPSFTIRITPSDFHKDRLPLLASILQIDESEIVRILEKNKRFSRFEQIRIARDVDLKTVSLIEENSDLLPGVDVSIDSKRLYEFSCNMAHFIGYTREISQPQLEIKKYYRQGDVIGQSGLEASYEDFLRGTKGINYIAVNRSGKKIESFNKGMNDQPVSNGFDLYLSIDKNLQERAEELLTGKRGAAVAIDPQNGEVLCIASKPDYDPRSFSGKVPAEIYNKLRDDPGVPLLNRSIQSQYPPGSTWKMLIALACLNEGLINENTTLQCSGSFFYGNRSYGCHGAHGSVNVQRAIQVSCNVFFYQAALKLGLQKFGDYGKMFGFGQLTHIDIPNEAKGIMPTIEWLKKRYGGNYYPKGSIVNFGIGQGEVAATPLQMASYCASIANGGTIYQPHLVRSINNNITHKVEKIAYGKRQIPINSRYFDIVRAGMYDVVNTPGGTASHAKVPGTTVCGKTGTAQNPHGDDHSWFVCYAPKDNPKIAMCVMVENAGYGATVAAPIAAELIRTYLFPKSAPIIARQDTVTKKIH